jgi:alginate O-acetyltransferase complex protein AlgI
MAASAERWPASWIQNHSATMLFNSHQFLFQFLPPTLIGFFALGVLGRPRAALFWLLGASIYFYLSWRTEDLWILLGSIAFNYAMSALLVSGSLPPRYRKGVLVVGVVGNLTALAYFKYSAFFVANLGGLFGTAWSVPALVLPLGISFYTFQQIAFLVEAWRGEFREPDLPRYCTVVTFFPHLIAGPIINYRAVIQQFRSPDFGRPREAMIAMGLTIFIMGMAKKVLLADSIAPQADYVFNAAAAGADVSLVEAWTGALAYTAQLYFDFSGYSDMAIGLALILGVRLPLNFNSPYKAENIADFWRRWHMTLSQFLRDYLYIPLGGNRCGPSRRLVNLMLTMVLGGLWHGAGWTFVIWGALHGFYLVVCHAWTTYFGAKAPHSSRQQRLSRISARTLTFVAVVFAWVFFRAPSLDSALIICKAMLGFNGLELPETLAGTPLGSLAASFGIEVASQELIPRRLWIALLACLLAIAFLAPNTQEWVGYSPSGPAHGHPWMHRLALRPVHGFAVGCLCFLLLTQLSAVTVFLYFQF